jgi:hypothetical protein
LLHEQSPGPLVTKNPEQLTPQALRDAILAVPCCLANNSTGNVIGIPKTIRKPSENHPKTIRKPSENTNAHFSAT